MLAAWVLPAVSELAGGRRGVPFQLGWAALAVVAGFTLGFTSLWLAGRVERLWRRLNPSGFHVALALVAAASVIVLAVGLGPSLAR